MRVLGQGSGPTAPLCSDEVVGSNAASLTKMTSFFFAFPSVTPIFKDGSHAVLTSFRVCGGRSPCQRIGWLVCCFALVLKRTGAIIATPLVVIHREALHFDSESL
ncbi:unnamed protein product [Arctogadus glacialis]